MTHWSEDMERARAWRHSGIGPEPSLTDHAKIDRLTAEKMAEIDAGEDEGEQEEEQDA